MNTTAKGNLLEDQGYIQGIFVDMWKLQDIFHLG